MYCLVVSVTMIQELSENCQQLNSNSDFTRIVCKPRSRKQKKPSVKSKWLLKMRYYHHHLALQSQFNKSKSQGRQGGKVGRGVNQKMGHGNNNHFNGELQLGQRECFFQESI